MAVRRSSAHGSSRSLAVEHAHDMAEHEDHLGHDERLANNSLDLLMDGVGGITRFAANTAFAASSAAASTVSSQVGGLVPTVVSEFSQTSFRRVRRLARASSASKPEPEGRPTDQVNPDASGSNGEAGIWSDIAVTGAPKWGGRRVRGRTREPRVYKKYRVITQSLPVYTLQQNERSPEHGRKYYCMSLTHGTEFHVVELFYIRGSIGERRQHLNSGWSTWTQTR